MLVMLLATAVFCVSAIPPIDLPETSYDETDTPVNQAPPVVQGIRYVKPPKVEVIVPQRTREAAQDLVVPTTERPILASASPPTGPSLLCVFRI
jgi:hypothetical protein